MKKCLVFGGTGALGSEVCKILKRESSEFAFTYYKNVKEAEQIGQSLGASYFQCDVTDPEGTKQSVMQAAQALGGLDSIVIATGISGKTIFYKTQEQEENFDKFLEISSDSFDEVLKINTRGAFLACQAAVPYLIRNGGGNIIFIGSLDGLKALPSPVHFAISKAALKGLIESLSKELGDYNIKVNQVALGLLDKGSSQFLSNKFQKEYLKHCALERFGKTSEAAELISWLALNNTYITGQSLLLDGGL